MKIEYVYTCCRCGKEFRNSNKLFGTAKVNVAKVDKTYYHINADYDYEEICPECFKELKHWLKGNSTSIDEIKRLHTEIDMLQSTLNDVRKCRETAIEDFKKIQNEFLLYKDQMMWYVEEVDTPRGKCTRSKDWRVVEKAAEIIKEYMKATEKYDFDFKDVLDCNKKAEKFLKDYNLNEETKSND